MLSGLGWCRTGRHIFKLLFSAPLRLGDMFQTSPTDCIHAVVCGELLFFIGLGYGLAARDVHLEADQEGHREEEGTQQDRIL